jgi:hypothetical protein
MSVIILWNGRLKMNIKDGIEGYWWLPEQSDRKIAGVLYTSNDGAHLLDLFGNFEGLPFLTNNNKYTIINGISSKGIHYTLFDSFHCCPV